MTENSWPEVHYQDHPLEAVSSENRKPINAASEKESDKNLTSPGKPFWKKKRWLLALVALILIVAIAVGVGVGVGVGVNGQHKTTTPTEE